jgi:hypothetical protein
MRIERGRQVRRPLTDEPINGVSEAEDVLDGVLRLMSDETGIVDRMVRGHADEVRLEFEPVEREAAGDAIEFGVRKSFNLVGLNEVRRQPASTRTSRYCTGSSTTTGISRSVLSW